MEDPTPKKLSAMLVEKHKRIIHERRRELDGLEHLVVLKEKGDQLEHWIQEDDNPEKYLEKREETAIELEKLKKQLQCKDPNEMYKKFSKELDAHTEALEYWREYERRRA